MNETSVNNLIRDFFTCKPEELTRLFLELLQVMQVDSNLASGGLMSRNYETAQANPEIHLLPGNLKDARDAVFPFFWGTDDWFSPLHLENVKGPANYASLIGSIACLLKNPNLCVDTYSQRSNELEVKAITALANLIFYHTHSPWGIFTMGGTISNLYAGKIGIEKVCPGTMAKGMSDLPVGIVSTAAHYSNLTLAGWLGIGTDNLISVPVDHAFSMRLDLLEEHIRKLYSNGRKVAFVIATVGSTDAFGVDDTAAIRKILDSLSQEFGMTTPHLHVDAAVGWVLCFFTEYDTQANPLQVNDSTLPVIRQAQQVAKGFQVADSVTIDFHKMGWGHYPSSAFIVNHRDNLAYLFRDKSITPYFCEAEYRRDPALFTLECSRPAIGPYTVMASLNGIGLQGYQVLVAHALELAQYLKAQLSRLDYCRVLNPENCGPHVLWWVLPKGRDAQAIYRRLLAGELPEAEAQRYFNEIRHLFDRRNMDLNPQLDARLSFTTHTGFAPHGVKLPAWKAVFFNPKTTFQEIDQIVRSLEDL